MLKMSIKVLGCAVALSTSAFAADITGAGSTFVYPVLSKWSANYNNIGGNKVNYQSIGSGGGIAQIKAGTVTFGATDKPLEPKELAAAGLAQFPVVVGGVVPVINVAGVKPGQLKLDGKTLADIYLGKVTNWNSPEIKALNTGLALPDQKITIVHRSDGSGTTFNFANYLGKVNPTWKSSVGEGTTVNWPTGLGGKGNEGVAAYVKQIKGSIGYVELAYAKQNKMTYLSLKNKDGQFVEPSAKTFGAAAKSADWAAPDFYEIITDAPGKNSWPITATTFALMYKQPKVVGDSKDALAFFKFAFERGAEDAAAMDYVPLPDALVNKIEKYWSTNIKTTK